MRHKLLTITVILMIMALLPVSVNAASKGKGPVLHMRFDEGGGPTAYDDGWTDTDSDGIKDSGESWNNNDGTLTPGDNTGSNDTAGEMWSIAGKIGSALECDGTNDYVNLGQSSTFNIGGGDFTISVWAKPNALSTGWTGFVYLGQVGSSNGHLGFDTSNHLAGGTGDGSTWQTHQTTYTIDTNWHHYVMKRESDRIYFYVDGSYNSDYAHNYTPANLDENAWIGQGTATEQFNGLIDDARVYDYARTAAQIKTDYNAGAAARLGKGTDSNEGNPPMAYWNFDENTGTATYDRSGSGYNGTLGGDGAGSDVPTWAQGKHGPALSFDGTDDYVDMGNSANLGTGPFTIELWVRQGSSGASRFVEKRQDNQEQWVFSLSGGKPYFIYNAGPSGTTDYAYTVSSTVLQQGKWYHLAAVVDRQSPYYPAIYVNGVYDGTSGTSVSGSPGTADMDNTGSLYIGRTTYNSVDNYFDGLVDEVKIYNYARTQAQIAYDYNKGAPVAHYRFDEGTGTIAHNSESSANSGAAPIGWWRMDNDWTDSSGNTNNGTATGATFSTSSKIGPYCGNFDGNDYVNCGTSTAFETGASGEFTYMAWINSSNYATTQTIMSKSYPCSNYSHFAIQVESNRVYLRFYSNLEANQYAHYSDAILTNGQTYHIAWVKKWGQTGVKLYINGVSQTVSGDSSARGTTYTGSPIFIGALNGNHGGTCESTPFPYEYFTGTIDDVRIYNYSRTAEQIYNDYKSTHATLYNGAKFADGKIGKALSLDGTNDYAFIEAPDYLFNSGDFSVGLWARPTVLDASYDGLISTDVAGDAAWKIFRNTGDSYFQAKYGTTNVSYSTVSAGDWHHYGYVKSGTDLILYLDGKYLSTTACPATHSVSGTKVVLGSYRVNDALDGYHIFNGLIDDVRIYNYARTAAQVTEDYAVSASRHGAKRTGVKDPWDGAMPVAHWKMDENTGVLARDASENTNDGTLKNNASWSQGKLGPCLSLDGSSVRQGVEVANNATLNFGTGSFSLSAWVNTTQTGEWKRIVTKRGSGADWYSMALGSGGKLRAEFYGTTANRSYATTGTVNDGNWHHCVVVRDTSANKLKLYIDGVLDYENTDGTGNLDNTKILEIGKWGTEAYDNGSYTGKIDDVSVYNYALTQAQVSWLYNRGAPVARWRFDEATSGAASGTDNIKDDSTHDNDGDGSGTNIAYTTGKFGGALTLNGTDDYVNCGTDSSLNMTTNDFTVSAWVKQASADKVANASIVGKYGTPGWNLMLDNGVARIYMYQEAGKSRSVSGSNIADNAWHYVAAVTDFDGYTRLYVDGIEVGTADNTSYDTMTTGQAVRIGTRNGGPYLKGTIDDVRIYNYARTAAQILQDFNAGAASRLGD